MDLKSYLQTMTLVERRDFAKRVGSSAGHLNNVSYGYRPCAESLAIEIEKASDGKVTCEELCPTADWAYLRGTAAQQQSAESIA